jgi:lysophospholipase L1-like esterase
LLLTEFTVTATPPKVINAGLPGKNSRDLLNQFESKVATHKPDLVILMVGSNDMLNSSNSQPLEVYRENMLCLVKKIRAIGAKVILMNLLPCNESYVLKRHPRKFFGADTPNGKINKANQILTKIAAAEKIPLVNAARIIKNTPLDNAPDSLLRNLSNSKAEDGVHPTATGYRLIAKAIAQAIHDYKITPSLIVCFGDSITCGIYVKLAGTAKTDAETYPGNLQRILNSQRF